MNPDHDNPRPSNPIETGEETLRLIAALPAPAGLEDRLHATLRSAAAPRSGRLLAWPPAPHSGNGWMRAAAAAAIAFVIAGGGWGVYSHVQTAQPGAAPIVPHTAVAGGFSGANAIRTPQTLNGPVVSHPATPFDQDAAAAHKAVVPAPAATRATPGRPKAKAKTLHPAAHGAQ